jgi:hypothetical protein
MNFSFQTLLFLTPFALYGAQPVDFNRDIKPILSENCYQCHGPDKNNRKAGMRLDNFAGATADNDGVRAIVPGDPEASEIFHRINATDPDEIMPPPEAKISLKPAQKELLAKWITSGAEYARHWAFVPPVKAITDPAAGHPIDQLVSKVHATNNLTPAPEADRATLIRRLSLDLTGLPPEPEEVAQFITDDAPDAYEKLVGRLLASPHYGERMAWEWMDAARYADTNGYQGDNERTMWPWRDWVIGAFNKNLPYDQFTTWQLAGDLLPNPTNDQILATGFCRNYPINGEGGRIAEENRAEYVMDMSETMGTVWLGLTLNCCRCHDHKFDPITQANYYQFTAFFNQTPVNGGGGDAQQAPNLGVPTETDQKHIAALDEKITQKQQDIKAHESTIANILPWATLHPTSATAEHQVINILDDDTILTSGTNPPNDSYTVVTATNGNQIAAIRLEAIRHESMTQGALARSDSGNFVLTDFKVELNGEPLKIASAKASFEQGDLKIESAFDENPKSGWAVLGTGSITTNHAAAFHFDPPIATKDGDHLTFYLRHDSQHPHHNIGKFQLSTSTHPGALLDNKINDPVLTKLQEELKALESERGNAQKSIPKVMVMKDMDKQRDTFILEKGIYSKHLEKVAMGVPESLHKMSESAPANRLSLAKWLTDKSNPLTARVTVNRFWQQLFGIGIVKTAENFGMQSETPQQQELLDWLAVDFAESGWDVKRLMRTIVNSQTYRQSSSSTTYADDPENRLLARGPRFRMPSWMLRDHALAVSGQLVRDIGGQPVNPYQPPGIWEETSFGKKKYTQDTGDKLYRRSLYTFWRRIAAPTAFFDNSSRQVCSVTPFRTNTPLHALYTFNDITFVEAARVLAENALALPDANARLNFIFQRVLSRSPKPAETAALITTLTKTKAHFLEAPKEAAEFLALGDSKRNESLDQTKHAAWTALCLAVLNLDEAVTKE